MKKNKEQKIIKHATAFAMHRCKLGYITKEQLSFILSEDEEKNLEIITTFAKKQKCDIVEIWYREDIKWDEIKFYKIYNFYNNINEEQFANLDIYKKQK